MVSIPGVPNLWTTVALLDEAARDTVDRLRRRGAVWWKGTRADAVADLVARYAAACDAVEGGARHEAPKRPSRDAVLADQLAVVSYDLVLALRAKQPGDRVGDTTVETLAAALLAETRALAEQVGSLGDLLLGIEGDPGQRSHDVE